MESELVPKFVIGIGGNGGFVRTDFLMSKLIRDFNK